MELSFILTIAAILVFGTLAWGALRGAPWVPTRRRDVARIVALAAPQRDDVVADVGCGDGTILAAFAAAGCRVRGWELALAPWLVARVRLRQLRDARVLWGDFWNANLMDADIVYAFLMPSALHRLAGKLARELRPGARVLTYVWPLPGWTADAVDRVAGSPPIYRYRVPAAV